MISDDLSPLAEDFIIPFDGHQYVGGYLRGEIIALMDYQNVLDFAYSFGFKVIDMVDDGCIKNGIKYSVNILRMV